MSNDEICKLAMKSKHKTQSLLNATHCHLTAFPFSKLYKTFNLQFEIVNDSKKNDVKMLL